MGRRKGSLIEGEREGGKRDGVLRSNSLLLLGWMVKICLSC